MRKHAQRDNTAFLYPRLSRDDNLDGDSYSITNQKKLLTKTAKDLGYTNLVTFVDDGVSGVTMERPGFQSMLKKLEQGQAAAVIVKDLSRLGRNYIAVGRLIEEFFPEHDIRLVSVAEGIDTREGDNDLTPIRNLFNEWYARDISKKRRISNRIKGGAGEPMGQPPYGYKKDPDNPKCWVVDEEAAAVVRKVFRWTVEGLGIEQIAAALTAEGVLAPWHYWLKQGIRRSGKPPQQPPCHWNSSTIYCMLKKQEYCGDIINFKTYSKSYKNKKRLNNDRENWAVFENVHEPIVSRELWQQVQQRPIGMRHRSTKEGEYTLFSGGLLRCAECGSNLHFHFNQGNHDIKYYSCSNYNKRHQCSSTHYVRVDFLEQVVLGEIRRLIKYAHQNESSFVNDVMGHSRQLLEDEQKIKKDALMRIELRYSELDNLFLRLYEDRVKGNLSDDRFGKLSRHFEEEQQDLSERRKALQAELEAALSRLGTVNDFLAAVQSYSRVQKLRPKMLRELVEYIVVDHAVRQNGVYRQNLTIHWHCIGVLTIPDTVPVPAVQVETRKGVTVVYAPTAG